MTSRLFWATVGAVVGVTAYRKGIESVDAAKHAGPLETAQAVAVGTGKLASSAVTGARKAASYAQDKVETYRGGSDELATAIPDDWRPVDQSGSALPSSTSPAGPGSHSGQGLA